MYLYVRSSLLMNSSVYFDKKKLFSLKKSGRAKARVAPLPAATAPVECELQSLEI